MNIRSKLTLRFILIYAVIFLVASVLIYIFSADYRRDTFLDRLRNKATNTAKLLIEVDEVSAELLRKIEKDNPVSLPNEKIIVYDYHNNILFSTDEARVLKVDKGFLDRIRLADEVTFEQSNYEGVGFLFKGRYDRFVVITAATDIYGLNKLRNLSSVLVIVFAISVVIVSISGWFFSGKALEPISRVVQQVDEISITSLDLRVDEGNGKDEIAKLAQTFNKMLERLEASFKIQKNFIANASHELRTPLTAITGQLEVTLQKERTNEEYNIALNSVLDDIKNLNKLSNRLLMLAQTSEDRKTTMMPLRIDELVWQVRDEIMKNNKDFYVAIRFDSKLDEEAALIVAGDEHSLKIALANIIENGCKYSTDHTTVVTISASSNGVILYFEDQGIGIHHQDLPNIFEPFYRGVNIKKEKGHGIGLSMVRSIVKLHAGTIQVKSTPGKGTTFTMYLPKGT